MARKPFKKKVNQKSATQGTQKPREKKEPISKEITFKLDMTVADVATAMHVSNAVLIKKLMQLGMMSAVTQILDRDTIELVAMEMGYTVIDEVITDLARFDEMEIEDDPQDLVKRSPI